MLYKYIVKLLESFQCQDNGLNYMFTCAEINSSIFPTGLEVGFCSVYFDGRMGEYKKQKDWRVFRERLVFLSTSPGTETVWNAKTK